VLQCVAVYCNVLFEMEDFVLSCYGVDVCSGKYVLQCALVCCGVLQSPI